MYLQSTFIRMPELEARVGLKKPTIYALVAAGKFPKPVKLGMRASAWVVSEVQEWELSRINGSRLAQAVQS